MIAWVVGLTRHSDCARVQSGPTSLVPCSLPHLTLDLNLLPVPSPGRRISMISHTGQISPQGPFFFFFFIQGLFY